MKNCFSIFFSIEKKKGGLGTTNSIPTIEIATKAITLNQNIIARA